MVEIKQVGKRINEQNTLAVLVFSNSQREPQRRRYGVVTSRRKSENLSPKTGIQPAQFVIKNRNFPTP
jgi:hypothetical protein